MKRPLLLVVLTISLSACASSPIEITSRDSRGGTQSKYYTSSDFCGEVVDPENRFAVFAVEKGTAMGGNRLVVWLYNPGDSELRVRAHTFSYHGTRIFVRKTVTVAPKSKIKLVDQSIAFEVYVSDHRLGYHLGVAGSREIGVIELQHKKRRDRSKALTACKAPESVTENRDQTEPGKR